MGLVGLWLLRPPFAPDEEQDGGEKGIVLPAEKVRVNPTPAVTCLQPQTESWVKSLQLEI